MVISITRNDVLIEMDKNSNFITIYNTASDCIEFMEYEIDDLLDALYEAKKAMKDG